MTVHRVEGAFSKLEYSSDYKWEKLNNPGIEFISSNDIMNFSFGYTYVGRQYYNKFLFFDDELEFDDHYNFEYLEYSFHLSLNKPQTIPFSEEFIKWAKQHNVPTISTQIPIANLPDISTKLFEYRKMLYRNTDNYLSLHIKN